MSGERQLPMFPLQSVLVPAAPLPLHVFEARYRALMDEVLASDPSEFGVVLIERGSEVGGGDVRTRTGTVARIIDAVQSPDGRWSLIALGTRRVDVVTWLPDDPYPAAVVVDRPEAPWDAEAGEALAAAERAVRRALALKAELGEAAVDATAELSAEPSTRAWQLIAIAPVTAFDRQALLATDRPAERVAALARLADEECDLLAHRMRGL